MAAAAVSAATAARGGLAPCVLLSGREEPPSKGEAHCTWISLASRTFAWAAALCAWSRGGRRLRGRESSHLTLSAFKRGSDGLDAFDTEEIQAALRLLGFTAFPNVKNRQYLLTWIQKLRIPATQLTEALLKVHRLSGKEDVGRKRPKHKSSQRSRRFQNFSPGQLRMCLKRIGVTGTGSFTKPLLVQKLQEIGLNEQDVGEVLREYGREAAASRKRTRPKRPVSAAEQEFFGGAGKAFRQEFRSFSRRQYGKTSRKEYMREEYSDWDDDDFDDIDDEDYDDYYDYTMDDEPWDSLPGDWDFEDFLEEESTAHFQGSYRAPRDYAQWSQPSQRSTRYAVPTMAPEEAMNLAMREGWTADKLSRSQASMLLGLSGNASKKEVSQVRRQMAVRWHPDKNPADSKANAKFQLVMAAADMFG